MLNGWNAKTISDDPATALKDINTSAANAANATNASRFSSTNNITNSSHHSHSAELSTEDYFIINDSIRMLWKCVSPPSQLGRSGSITPSIFVRLMWRLDAVAAASGDVVSPHVYSEMKDAAQSQNQSVTFSKFEKFFWDLANDISPPSACANIFHRWSCTMSRRSSAIETIMSQMILPTTLGNENNIVSTGNRGWYMTKELQTILQLDNVHASIPSFKETTAMVVNHLMRVHGDTPWIYYDRIRPILLDMTPNLLLPQEMMLFRPTSAMMRLTKVSEVLNNNKEAKELPPVSKETKDLLNLLLPKRKQIIAAQKNEQKDGTWILGGGSVDNKEENDEEEEEEEKEDSNAVVVVVTKDDANRINEEFNNTNTKQKKHRPSTIEPGRPGSVGIMTRNMLTRIRHHAHSGRLRGSYQELKHVPSMGGSECNSASILKSLFNVQQHHCQQQQQQQQQQHQHQHQQQRPTTAPVRPLSKRNGSSIVRRRGRQGRNRKIFMKRRAGIKKGTAKKIVVDRPATAPGRPMEVQSMLLPSSSPAEIRMSMGMFHPDYTIETSIDSSTGIGIRSQQRKSRMSRRRKKGKGQSRGWHRTGVPPGQQNVVYDMNGVDKNTMMLSLRRICGRNESSQLPFRPPSTEPRETYEVSPKLKLKKWTSKGSKVENTRLHEANQEDLRVVPASEVEGRGSSVNFNSQKKSTKFTKKRPASIGLLSEHHMILSHAHNVAKSGYYSGNPVLRVSAASFSPRSNQCDEDDNTIAFDTTLAILSTSSVATNQDAAAGAGAGAAAAVWGDPEDQDSIDLSEIGRSPLRC